MKLLGQLWYDQESSPALALLGFQNVTKDVVTNVDNIFAFCTQQVTYDVRRTCGCKHQTADKIFVTSFFMKEKPTVVSEII